MNIYVDIDGVLLTSNKQAANGAEKFLELITDRFNCYWLTTHCRDGDARQAIEYVNKFIKIDRAILEKVKPCKFWSTYKTEAIDFDQDFYWLDDNLFDGERKILKENNAIDKMIYVELAYNPNQLFEIGKEIKTGDLFYGTHCQRYYQVQRHRVFFDC